MKALGKLAIGTQGPSSHPNALSHYADRSKTEKNPNNTCNFADFHLSSFGRKLPLCSSGTNQYTSLALSL
jgi:hypothetical protein